MFQSIFRSRYELLTYLRYKQPLTFYFLLPILSVMSTWPRMGIDQTVGHKNQEISPSQPFSLIVQAFTCLSLSCSADLRHYRQFYYRIMAEHKFSYIIEFSGTKLVKTIFCAS